jgi:hypothetical protein
MKILLVVLLVLARIDGIASNYGTVNRNLARPHELSLRGYRFSSSSLSSWRIPKTRTFLQRVLHLRGGGPRDEVLIDYSKDPISESSKERATQLCQEAWTAHGDGDVLEAERLYNQALREVISNRFSHFSVRAVLKRFLFVLYLLAASRSNHHHAPEGN